MSEAGRLGVREAELADVVVLDVDLGRRAPVGVATRAENVQQPLVLEDQRPLTIGQVDHVQLVAQL